MQRQRGAILLAVLIVSVILAMLIAAATTIMQSRFRIAENSQSLLQEKAAAYAKVNEIGYLIATQRLTPAGISKGTNPQAFIRNNEDDRWQHYFTGDEIRVDGFTIEQQIGTTPVKYSIQAENGLIPVNTSNQFWLKTWLAGYQLSPFEQAKLADSLADYADDDDWIRPAGAEAKAYRDEPGQPANYLLQKCTELRMVKNWSALTKRNPSIVDECSLSRSGIVNLNAVPIALWKRLWPGSADKVAQARLQNRWIVSEQDILNTEPGMTALPEEYYTIVGRKYFIITAWTRHFSLQVRVQRGANTSPPLKVWKRPPITPNEEG